jgi:UDP-N-acetylglucosamine acyltransferase
MAQSGIAKAFRKRRVAGLPWLPEKPAVMVTKIHPSSIVEAGAQLAEGVEIGPFCTVGPKVKLGEAVRLISHVSIFGSTSIGARTVIYPFAALGTPPQDTKYKGEDTRLIVGTDNIIRENVCFHLGTKTGRQMTVIGNGGFFMNGSHVGHDCIVGDKVVFSTHSVTGGLAKVDDFVILGGLSAIHQLGRVGMGAFVGGGAPVVGDVIPFGMVDNHGRLHGLNIIGLKRRGVKRETINELRAVYRELFLGAGHFEDRLAEIAERHAGSPEVMMIVDFINAGQKRPLCVPRHD